MAGMNLGRSSPVGFTSIGCRLARVRAKEILCG